MTDLRKITIRLTNQQLHQLRTLYPNVGYNAILRKLVDAHLRKRFEALREGITNDPSTAPIEVPQDPTLDS